MFERLDFAMQSLTLHQYMRAVSPLGGRDTNGAKTNAAHTSKEHISEILQFQFESTLEVLICYF